LTLPWLCDAIPISFVLVLSKLVGVVGVGVVGVVVVEAIPMPSSFARHGLSHLLKHEAFPVTHFVALFPTCPSTRLKMKLFSSTSPSCLVSLLDTFHYWSYSHPPLPSIAALLLSASHLPILLSLGSSQAVSSLLLILLVSFPRVFIAAIHSKTCPPPNMINTQKYYLTYGNYYSLN
jgi:hypothetical protein